MVYRAKWEVKIVRRVDNGEEEAVETDIATYSNYVDFANFALTQKMTELVGNQLFEKIVGDTELA